MQYRLHSPQATHSPSPAPSKSSISLAEDARDVELVFEGVAGCGTAEGDGAYTWLILGLWTIVSALVWDGWEMFREVGGEDEDYLARPDKFPR